MQNQPTNTAVNNVAIVGGIIGGCIVLGVMFFGLSYIHQGSNSPAAGAPNYTRLICQDAHTSEKHYDDQNIQYIDVDLAEGCFSGYIALPKKWTGFQLQMLNPSTQDWVAEWFEGDANPTGPYSAAAVTSMKVISQHMHLRLEGRGRARLNCVSGCPESAAP